MAEGAGTIETSSGLIKGYFEDDLCQIIFNDSFKGQIFGHPVKVLVSRVFNDETLESYELDGICQAELISNKGVVLEYQGEMKKGHITGEGVIVRNDEILYEGRFLNGFLQGFGRLNVKPKVYYIGEFERNQATGIGQFKTVNELEEG